MSGNQIGIGRAINLPSMETSTWLKYTEHATGSSPSRGPTVPVLYSRRASSRRQRKIRTLDNNEYVKEGGAETCNLS